MSKVLIFLFTLCLSSIAWALTSAQGLDMLEQTSAQLLSHLQAQDGRLTSDSKGLEQILEQVLVPHIDQETMARRVVGREYWTLADSDQRQRFIENFKKIVVQTYAKALSSYRNQKISFLPLRPSENQGASEPLLITSLIKQDRGTETRVEYYLSPQDKEWKVYDFSVDGVSLVQSYKSQFQNILAQKGLDGLIQELEKRQSEKGAI